MNEVNVKYAGGKSFRVQARQHAMIIDLPPEKGGQDLGMNPPEVFMASLGSCIGVYVAGYCRGAKLDTEGLNIRLCWKLSDDNTKISEINVCVSLPKANAGKRQKAILEVAHHCLIHNTILGNPVIHMSLTE
jgi:putative redox protein